MSEQVMLQVLRAQAWERAKGELQSILQAYYSDRNQESNFNRMSDRINSFVTDVEDNELWA